MSRVSAYDFFKTVISCADLDTVNGHEDGKYHLILETYNKETKEIQSKILHSDTSFEYWLNKAYKSEKTIRFSPYSYCGSNITAENTRMQLGFVISLRLDKKGTAKTLFTKTFNKETIRPTFVFNKNSCWFLLFLFDKPVPFFNHYSKQINHAAKYISSLLSANVAECGVRYFAKVITDSFLIPRNNISRFGNPISIQELNDTFLKNCPITYNSNEKTTIEEAKEKYPEWYNRVIENGKETKTGLRYFVVNANLYKWWIKETRKTEDANIGGTAIAICSYGAKCNIPIKQVTYDISSYLVFRGYSYKHANIEAKRIIDTYFNDISRTYTKIYISEISGIKIKDNKRNHRTLKEHLRLLHESNRKKYEEDPTSCGSKILVIRDWRKAHPHGKASECVADTGLSRSTVYKWWKKCLQKKIKPAHRRLSKKEKAARRRIKETYCRHCGAYVSLFTSSECRPIISYKKKQAGIINLKKHICPQCKSTVLHICS